MPSYIGPLSSATLRNEGGVEDFVLFPSFDPGLPELHPYTQALVAEGWLVEDGVDPPPPPTLYYFQMSPFSFHVGGSCYVDCSPVVDGAVYEWSANWSESGRPYLPILSGQGTPHVVFDASVITYHGGYISITCSITKDGVSIEEYGSPTMSMQVIE